MKVHTMYIYPDKVLLWFGTSLFKSAMPLAGKSALKSNTLCVNIAG